MTTGEWQQIGVTWDGSNVRLYRNGGLENTVAQGGTPFNSSKDLRIGAFSDSAIQFDGPIDEVRLSSTARSGDWITTCYNNQNNPTASATAPFFTTLGTETGAGGEDPVPELPTIVLISVGLVGLVIYLWLKRRRLVYAP